MRSSYCFKQIDTHSFSNARGDVTRGDIVCSSAWFHSVGSLYWHRVTRGDGEEPKGGGLEYCLVTVRSPGGVFLEAVRAG